MSTTMITIYLATARPSKHIGVGTTKEAAMLDLAEHLTGCPVTHVSLPPAELMERPCLGMTVYTNTGHDSYIVDTVRKTVREPRHG